MMTVFSANANSLKNKMDSLKFNITSLKPHIIVIQETKLKRKSQCSLQGYKCFNTVRGDSGGGLTIACKISLEPAKVYEGDDENEVLVVQVKMMNMDIRIIAGYGAQECAPTVIREKYRTTIEEQIIRSYLAGCEVIVAEDANAKLGPDTIPNDPHITSENGKLLNGMIRRQNLTLVNASYKCEGGPITRSRIVDGRIEESCIDFILLSPKIGELLVNALIDKKRVYALTKYCTTKGNPSVKKSDHYSLIAHFKIKENISIPIRREIFKLRDDNGLCRFKEMTTNNAKLRNLFLEDMNVEDRCNKWYKLISKLMHQCFKKVKITDRPPRRTLDFDIYSAMNDLKLMKDNLDKAHASMQPVLALEIIRQEEIIATLQGNKCRKIIFEDMQKLMRDGCFSFNDAWKLKKKIFPRSNDSPFGLLDKNNNLVADYKGILEIMKDEFVFRLRDRDIKDEYKELRDLKEYLCRLRLHITRRSDFGKWDMKDLKKALARLKTNKCKDPHGHINELYMNMGEDGLRSLLNLLNQIKECIIIPTKLNLSNVSTIYKGKGSMQNVLNLRGIFKLPIIRNLLDRLVCMDEQERINTSMGPFQVGNQTGRNIRDHSLVVHAIINEAQNEKSNIDIQFTDIKQCFDSIWLDEALNDLFDSGVTSRNLNLIYEGNSKTRMCVETQFGQSDRVELRKIVMQGSVTGGAICSNQLSKLCNKMYKEGNVYMYRKQIPVPSLAMVDDLANISVCNTVEGLSCNIKTDSFIQRKKLESQVGEGKCQWVHIGPGNCSSQYMMEGDNITQANEYKYLGDSISNELKILYEKRWEKAQGYSSMCLAMSTETSLGFQIYNIAKLYHMSIFVNGSLLNMETWPHCTKERIESFQRIEQTFFRKILQAHSKTPIEAIYLELGVIPLRYHLIRRRILYLHDIMNRNADELTTMVVEAQKVKSYKGDFYPQVMEDMIELGITNDDLAQGKETLREKLKAKSKECAFKELIEKAKSHTKIREDIYTNLDGAMHYNNSRFTPDVSNLIFRLRTRTFMVKNNFRNNYRNTNTLCPLCEEHNDDQDHLLQCCKILAEYKRKITCKMDDIYSNNESILFTAAQTINDLVEIRNSLLDSADPIA